jgi:ankyrin repeat protein
VETSDDIKEYEETCESKGINEDSLEDTINDTIVDHKLDIVEFLLEQKVIDVNAKTRYNKTALILAVKIGHSGIVKALLERGN